MFDLIETEKNLLLVDENSETANLLNRLLRSKYNCDRVETSEAALWKLKQKEYSVVLCNANLLKSDSLQIIPQMQIIAPHSAVILWARNVRRKMSSRHFAPARLIIF